MSFKLTILGCNSAIPTISRFTTAQALQKENKVYLIDAGEGVQIRLKNFKVKTSKIHEIFISHLHGDHFFGLPGLLTSLNLSGRTKPLTIFGPVGLASFIDTLKTIGTLYLSYELIIRELCAEQSELIFEDSHVKVFTLPLKHRIPTTGFLFREKSKARKLIAENIEKHGMSIDEIKQIKANQNILRPDGTTLYYENLTSPPESPSSYAYCSDTIYDEGLVPLVRTATLLYHEATYLDNLKEKARERGHATALEAAKIAKLANVQMLVLGHYSSRYKDLSPFIEEAQKVFNDVHLAEDGREFTF